MVNVRITHRDDLLERLDYLPGYSADNKALNFTVPTLRKITHLLYMTKLLIIHR